LSSFLLSLSIDHQITRHLSFLEGDRGFWQSFTYQSYMRSILDL
jgi:hypothetical protein